MKRHHFLIALHSLVFAAASLLLFNYLRLDGILFNPVITYPNTVASTSKQVYRVGETVYGVQSFCVKRNTLVEVDYFLVDTFVRTYPTKVLRPAVGCYDEKTYEMEPLPPGLPPDTYHFEIHYTVHLNPINTVEWTRKSNDFQVVN